MLEITIPATEMWDEANQEFINTKAQTLQLEHSLVSLSNGSQNGVNRFSRNKRKRSKKPLTI